MKSYKQFLSIVVVCLTAICARAQSEAFEREYQQGEEFVSLRLYDLGIQKYLRAIEIADSFDLAEGGIQARISYGETLRKTQDFNHGLEILRSIRGSEAYPLLHVQKLGRISAILAERGFEDNSLRYDSVRYYLDDAIALAEEHRFLAELASLRNELGSLLCGVNDPVQGSSNLLESARLYQELRDTVGTVRALLNATGANPNWDADQRDSVIAELVKLVEGKDWPALQLDVYNVMWRLRSNRGDSLGVYQFKLKACDRHIRQIEAAHSNSMAANRVIHDTEKIKEEVRIREEALVAQTARNQELAIYLSLLGALVLGVLGLLFRERKLKRQVNVANDKYHELIVESNHRIKNNLQMIISMLEYTSKDLDERDNVALKSMSGKIHTISALHKHLYVDVHNEYVNLGTYFREIVTLYAEITPTAFQIEDSLDQVEIKSERIIYFGLVFNEMLSNTIEHSKKDELKIRLGVSNMGDYFVFDYQDDSSRPEEATAGMGTKLIKQLIRRVGGKDYRFNPSNGHYQFRFHA